MLIDRVAAALTAATGRSVTGVAAAKFLRPVGPGESLRRLAAWMTEQDRLGVLAVPDPLHAAEMFCGMVLGHGHLRAVLGLPHPEADDGPARARETARRFIRAFAPV